MGRSLRLILQMHSLDRSPPCRGERDPLGKAIPGPQVPSAGLEKQFFALGHSLLMNEARGGNAGRRNSYFPTHSPSCSAGGPGFLSKVHSFLFMSCVRRHWLPTFGPSRPASCSLFPKVSPG